MPRKKVSDKQPSPASNATPEQAELLRKIEEKNKEILEAEDEADEWQMEDNPFNANDCKAEADYAARELIELLEEAAELGMNTDDFPKVRDLTWVYITEPRDKLRMAGGSGCH